MKIMKENEEGDEENERLLYLHKNIETKLAKFAVVPHAGTWSEIQKFHINVTGKEVVPHAGTWIEIPRLTLWHWHRQSFPTRERGLKLSLVH